jgi:hypothetical protein
MATAARITDSPIPTSCSAGAWPGGCSARRPRWRRPGPSGDRRQRWTRARSGRRWCATGVGLAPSQVFATAYPRLAILRA